MSEDLDPIDIWWTLMLAGEQEKADAYWRDEIASDDSRKDER